MLMSCFVVGVQSLATELSNDDDDDDDEIAWSYFQFALKMFSLSDWGHRTVCWDPLGYAVEVQLLLASLVPTLLRSWVVRR